MKNKNNKQFDEENKMKTYNIEKIKDMLKPACIKKIERAVQIANEMADGEASHTQEYIRIANYLESKVGFEDADALIQQWQ